MKMKKIVMGLLIALAMSAPADRILWVGIDESAKVNLGEEHMLLSQWWTTLSCAPVDVGARILVDGVPMPSGYEDPSGYIPPGQTAPTIFFDDEVTEFGVLLVDENEEPTGLYADWTPTRLDNTSLTAIVSFDIGYWE